MSGKLIVLAVAVLGVAVAVQAAGRGGDGKRGGGDGKRGGGDGKREGGHRCHGYNISAMTECCPGFPSIIQQSSWTNCNATVRAAQPATPEGDEPKGEGKNRGCIMECAFKAENLLTSAGVVDLAALNARLTPLATGAWATPITNAQAACTAAAPSVKPGQTCSSGAKEVSKCLFKSLKAACPAPSTTPECVARRLKMQEHETREAARDANKQKAKSG